MVKNLVYGVGTNDADYVIKPVISGKPVPCKIYRVWASMLQRCYYEKAQEHRPSYIGCTVCDEWLIFSNFRSWMIKQDWQGKQLDKDILFVGNKVYSPKSCVFVDALVNSFITDGALARGATPIGVTFYKRNGTFKSSCSNPFNKIKENLGYFDCPQKAHLAWKSRKHQLACQLADIQKDERVAIALRSRYS